MVGDMSSIQFMTNPFPASGNAQSTKTLRTQRILDDVNLTKDSIQIATDRYKGKDSLLRKRNKQPQKSGLNKTKDQGGATQSNSKTTIDGKQAAP